MKCTVVSIESKLAKSGNYYVCVVAKNPRDPFAEMLKYYMFCSEQLAQSLEANKPKEIELEKVTVTVPPFKHVSDDGVIDDRVVNKLSVVCRQFDNAFVDVPQDMANELRRTLLRDGKIVDVEVDAFAGGIGATMGNDLPE